MGNLNLKKILIFPHKTAKKFERKKSLPKSRYNLCIMTINHKMLIKSMR